MSSVTACNLNCHTLSRETQDSDFLFKAYSSIPRIQIQLHTLSFGKNSETSMATRTKLFAAATIVMVILFANLEAVRSEPAISASPAVLPYVNAPNMSSFFPSQAPPQWPTSSAVPPDAEAFTPIPSSGEFVGKSSCTSAKSGGGIVMLLELFIFLVMRTASTV